MMHERAREALHMLGSPLVDDASLAPLMARVGDARIVMLGESSHGTREFYEWRTRITMRLVREKGFRFIAVEGDWPDCFLLNEYVKDAAEAEPTAYDALYRFERWPTWMWANQEVQDLIEQLRDHNDTRNAGQAVGFYGLDIYSLFDSLRRVIVRLDVLGTEAAQAARDAWECLAPYGEDAQRYALATESEVANCRGELARMLAATRQHLPQLRADGSDERLDTEQNAVCAFQAEAYYRAMMKGAASSWNVRDTHMMDTLDRLLQHHGPRGKAVVWAHNTHIGDARATDMARAGEVNIGQLARERYGRANVLLVGFGTHHGEVVAARGWEETPRVMQVPDGRAGSLEDVLHAAGEDRLILFDGATGAAGHAALRAPLPHRAIGVVYHPEREHGNYVPTVVPERYDAFVFVDGSRAVRPLHVHVARRLIPETFPWGV